MDCMLDTFLAWQERVATACKARGHWCDAADPRSGYPIAGSRAQRFNEVAAAHALLGYEVVQNDAACPLLSHPLHGELPRLTLSVKPRDHLTFNLSWT